MGPFFIRSDQVFSQFNQCGLFRVANQEIVRSYWFALRSLPILSSKERPCLVTGLYLVMNPAVPHDRK